MDYHVNTTLSLSHKTDQFLVSNMNINMHGMLLHAA